MPSNEFYERAKALSADDRRGLLARRDGLPKVENKPVTPAVAVPVVDEYDDIEVDDYAALDAEEEAEARELAKRQAPAEG